MPALPIAGTVVGRPNYHFNKPDNIVQETMSKVFIIQQLLHDSYNCLMKIKAYMKGKEEFTPSK